MANETSIRADQVRKGMTIRVAEPGQPVFEMEVSFARKHRRYAGCMMIQGTPNGRPLVEISPRTYEIFTRVK